MLRLVLVMSGPEVSCASKRFGLIYKVKKFELNGQGRCVLLNKNTFVLSIAASVYEAAYARGPKRYKSSIYTLFHHVAYLLTWGDSCKFDVEKVLLSGVGLDFISIKKFANWLETVVLSAPAAGPVNNCIRNILRNCCVFCVWFVKNYTPLVSSNLDSNFRYVELLRSHRECWYEVMVGTKLNPVAPDLSDMELIRIESFLKERVDTAKCDIGLHLRNYILWRLIRSLGLRIGEALALRLQDIDLTGTDASVQIVRIEERGPDYKDPRAPYSPLVKTLGRLLYFSNEDRDLVDYIDLYISKFRVAKKKSGVGNTNFLSHDFLFVSHGTAFGYALSGASASKIARLIRLQCVPGFHWHLLRHAVFNRLYKAASAIDHNTTEIDHIVYMGGWGSPESLRYYAKRAIRDRTRERMISSNNAGAE
jgi:integrase